MFLVPSGDLASGGAPHVVVLGDVGQCFVEGGDAVGMSDRIGVEGECT